jgi:hypothetical protein
MAGPLEHTPFLSQWRLVRSAIEHENTLKSHRITWFLATQLFLVTGFSSIFIDAIKNSLFMSLKVYAALFTIASLGIYACVLARVNLSAAEKMITRLQNWWLINCHDAQKELPEWIHSAKYGSRQKHFPPVNGMFTSNRHMWFGEAQLPTALAMFWLALLLGTTALVFQRRFGIPLLASSLLLILLGGFAAFVYQTKIKAWLEAPSSEKAKELESIAKKVGFKRASEGDMHREIMEILSRHPIHHHAASPTDADLTASPPPAAGPAP